MYTGQYCTRTPQVAISGLPQIATSATAHFFPTFFPTNPKKNMYKFGIPWECDANICGAITQYTSIKK